MAYMDRPAVGKIGMAKAVAAAPKLKTAIQSASPERKATMKANFQARPAVGKIGAAVAANRATSAPPGAAKSAIAKSAPGAMADVRHRGKAFTFRAPQGR